MPQLVALLVLLTCSIKTEAQSSFCLSPAGSTSWIDYKPGELNRFLHLDRYKIVFFGEHHNDRFDPEFKYHLITELNKLSGIRHIFMETSVSAAWRRNRYLQTGDTTYLSNSFSGYNNSYTLFWNRLYSYNASLPDSLKIIIHGVDFETAGVFPVLKQLSPVGQSIPASLQAVMDTVAAHLSDPPLRMWEMIDGKFTLYDHSAFTKTLRYVQGQFLSHANDARAYFGSNYSVVHAIALNDAPVEVKPARRNKSMFSAISRAIKEQNIEKFAGFFGAQHTRYSVGGSISNKAMELPGIRSGDILNIAEAAYRTKPDSNSVYTVKSQEELAALMGPCKAAAMPASAVPGYKKWADFMIVVDLSE